MSEPGEGSPISEPGDPKLALRFRRPVEDDHRRIVAVIDDWWGGRRPHHLLPRLWLQHFTGTSWVAETGDGRLAGFLVGFVSPDHPDTAYVHLVAANPSVRRRGTGSALYARFIDDVRFRGVRRVVAITWPGNRLSLAFHRSLGFRARDGEGTRPVYGTPAIPDYEGDGSEITVLELDLDGWARDGLPGPAGPGSGTAS